MARINRRPSANRRSTLVDPAKTASGSMAEKFRSSILGAPDAFRKSSFDPDAASFDELRARSGEIATAMKPAPEELTFSDTGKVRDIFRQEGDRWEPGSIIPGEFTYDRTTEPTEERKRAMDTALNKYMTDIGMGLIPPETEFDFESYMFEKIPKMSEPTFVPGGVEVGKALTTGRLLREHPDKFKTEGEAGGRFFGRIPAIKRRTDVPTAFPTMPKTSPYGTPGGMKFIDESAYLGKPDSSLIGL